MKVLAVCGGMGVFLYPLKKYLIGNVEVRGDFVTPENIQWELNFKGIPYYKELPDVEVDFVVGAPNCGHSSVLSYSRKKAMSNPLDDKSINLFFSSIDKYKPKYWALENLTPLLDNIPKEDLTSTFHDYTLVFHSISVSLLGNSQVSRKRLFVFAIRKDICKPHILKAFQHITKFRRLKKAGELLKGLEETNTKLCHVREDEDDTITLYAGYKDKIGNIKGEWIKRGVSRWQVKDRNFTTAPGIYLNPRDKFPSTARKSNRQFNYRGEMMTPRELARIMGLPDSFKIWYSEDRKKSCINKGRNNVTKNPPYEYGLYLRNRINLIIRTNGL